MKIKQRFISWVNTFLEFLDHASFITTALAIIFLMTFLTTKRETMIFDILDRIFIFIIFVKSVYGLFHLIIGRASQKGFSEFLLGLFFLALYGWANYLQRIDAPLEIKPLYIRFAIILKGLLYCFYLVVNKRKIMAYIKKMRLDTVRSFTLGFIFLIFLGAWLLSLPYATTKPTPFLDNLFTSTSAVCVTGLSTLDFGTQYTLFGQIVVLFLIQMGGLGIMTFTAFLLIFSGEKMGFEERKGTLEIFNQKSLQTLKGLLTTMLLSTFIIEMAGAVSIFMSVPQYDFWNRFFFSIFHSVSAFCNAGFSPLPDNLMSFYSNTNINITISTLIILGGIGFPVILNIKERFFNKKNLLVHSKIVLIMTFFLIIAGMALFYFEENYHVLRTFTTDNKLLASFFQSVTTRTAGFNTVDIAALQNSTYFWMIILMFIGASPVSTGGGFKTTAFFVMVALIYNIFKQSSGTYLFQQRITGEVLIKTGALFFSRAAFIVFGAILICHFDPKVDPLKVVFEAVSAFSTVGLSAGVTPTLSEPSKIVVILLMFIGRIGILNIFAFMLIKRSQRSKQVHYPEGYVILE